MKLSFHLTFFPQAQKHFNTTKHSIVESFEPQEDWRWCYVDETYAE